MLTQLNYLTANKMSYEKEITCPYFKTKTNSIEQRPSCEAYSRTTRLNIHEPLSNPKFHFRLSGCPGLDHIQRELNTVHKFRPALFYSSIQLITLYPLRLRAILILLPHLHLGLKSGFSTQNLRIKYYRHFSSFSFVFRTRYASVSPLLTLKICGEFYNQVVTT
jgi:hypothetical protein